ncbi:hypothetical protein RJ640_000881 [Escallonia rubra]|uniref:Peptidase S8/S53 domain-containing protein n=1 Tax=Escallonia rubra TaxID=112253 RepID=A0AA88U5E9_9ASTE|nr:hypothetical protein RJ640_000881 [Escallonia rubra]
MLVYSYSHVMHGFSARLTLSAISAGAAPDSSFHISGVIRDVIIGLFDTGIWPESESFSDSGMSPIPGRWKGTCENGTDFSASLCNKKLIGARAFNKGFLAAGGRIRHKDFNSTRDFDGHGTRTSSTASGNHVPDTGADTAASDILAAMDQAIMDGVDVMSLSIGLGQAPYFDDPIAIASLSAVERGIFVTCAAGNYAFPSTTENGAPWITTVGASTIDRSFVGKLKLGNGFSLEGTSYFPQSVLVSD